MHFALRYKHFTDCWADTHPAFQHHGGINGPKWLKMKVFYQHCFNIYWHQPRGREVPCVPCFQTKTRQWLGHKSFSWNCSVFGRKVIIPLYLCREITRQDLILAAIFCLVIENGPKFVFVLAKNHFPIRCIEWSCSKDIRLVVSQLWVSRFIGPSVAWQ